MTNYRRCPNCGCASKLQGRQTVWNHEMRHIRTCTACPTEFVVSYADPTIEEVNTIE